jgi:hypothetical protein
VGLQLRLDLTTWFTVDLLIAFALFVTAMVVAFARPPVDRHRSPAEA